MAEGGEEQRIELAPCGRRPLPLNSKRLKVAYMQQLARALEVPTAASSDDVRQMIEGKLRQMGREPPNVQVIVQQGIGQSRVHLSLQDADGVFLEAEPETEPEWGATEDPPTTDERAPPEERADETEKLKQALAEATEENAALAREVSLLLRERVERGQCRVKELWRLNCEQLEEHDLIVSAKDEELESLKARLQGLEVSRRVPGRSLPSTMELPRRDSPEVEHRSTDSRLSGMVPPRRRGKAPPIDPFTGENPEVRLDNWLPALERASTWNGWTEEERLIQLAGHLRDQQALPW